jgi:hypothetical protein
MPSCRQEAMTLSFCNQLHKYLRPQSKNPDLRRECQLELSLRVEVTEKHDFAGMTGKALNLAIVPVESANIVFWAHG